MSPAAPRSTTPITRWHGRGRRAPATGARRAAGAPPDAAHHAVAWTWQAALATGLVTDVRAQYVHSRLAAPANDLIGPAINISGVASWGTAPSSPTDRLKHTTETTA